MHFDKTAYRLNNRNSTLALQPLQLNAKIFVAFRKQVVRILASESAPSSLVATMAGQDAKSKTLGEQVRK